MTCQRSALELWLLWPQGSTGCRIWGARHVSFTLQLSQIPLLWPGLCWLTGGSNDFSSEVTSQHKHTGQAQLHATFDIQTSPPTGLLSVSENSADVVPAPANRRINKNRFSLLKSSTFFFNARFIHCLWWVQNDFHSPYLKKKRKDIFKDLHIMNSNFSHFLMPYINLHALFTCAAPQENRAGLLVTRWRKDVLLGAVLIMAQCIPERERSAWRPSAADSSCNSQPYEGSVGGSGGDGKWRGQ